MADGRGGGWVCTQDDQAAKALMAMPRHQTVGLQVEALCLSVGRLDMASMPPGHHFDLSECSRCGVALWVGPRLVAACLARGLELVKLCEVCQPDTPKSTR